MLLSDAIRAGCAISRQVFGMLSDGNGGTCAIGAGLEGFGAQFIKGVKRLFVDNLSDLIPQYARYNTSNLSGTTMVLCPECDDVKDCLMGRAMHLNDYHVWSREAIADWLEEEEVKLGLRPMIPEGDTVICRPNEVSLDLALALC